MDPLIFFHGVVGIEFPGSTLQSLMITLVVTGVGLIVVLYPQGARAATNPGKEPLYYTLFLLQDSLDSRGNYTDQEMHSIYMYLLKWLLSQGTG